MPAFRHAGLALVAASALLVGGGCDGEQSPGTPPPEAAAPAQGAPAGVRPPTSRRKLDFAADDLHRIARKAVAKACLRRGRTEPGSSPNSTTCPATRPSWAGQLAIGNPGISSAFVHFPQSTLLGQPELLELWNDGVEAFKARFEATQVVVESGDPLDIAEREAERQEGGVVLLSSARSGRPPPSFNIIPDSLEAKLCGALPGFFESLDEADRRGLYPLGSAPRHGVPLTDLADALFTPALERLVDNEGRATSRPVNPEISVVSIVAPFAGGKNENNDEIEQLLAHRLFAALLLPKLMDPTIDTFVAPALGCGRAKFNPSIVARQFEAVLAQIPGVYNKVIFAVPDDTMRFGFQTVFRRASRRGYPALQPLVSGRD